VLFDATAIVPPGKGGSPTSATRTPFAGAEPGVTAAVAGARPLVLELDPESQAASAHAAAITATNLLMSRPIWVPKLFLRGILAKNEAVREVRRKLQWQKFHGVALA
jgi:hypothetical protein